MKAAVYYENGGPEVLRYEDVPDPVCPDGGLVVRVLAISIEGGDTVNRWRGPLATRPHIVGYQAAGEVVEVGRGVSDFRVGQKVTTTGTHGSHAALRAVSAKTAWLIPEGLDVKVAATIPIPFGTADNCLFEYGKVKSGDTVLIQSGASGVGVAAIQLAKQAGATVIATASSDERLEAIRALGVDHGINSAREDIAGAVKKLTDGKGVALALDGNSGRPLEASIASLGWKGRVAFIGFSGRESSKVDVSSLVGGNRSIHGLSLGMEMTTPRVRRTVEQLIERIARGELRVLIDREYPLSEAAAAHAYLESRRAVGRVLMIP
ncbi:MAG TPA: zinc-binding alcohol dehydrogenase family protein [Polyangiales bacterium]